MSRTIQHSIRRHTLKSYGAVALLLAEDVGTFYGASKGYGGLAPHGVWEFTVLPSGTLAGRRVSHCPCGYVGHLVNEGYADLYPWCPHCGMV
jgi:hypothetical protein